MAPPGKTYPEVFKKVYRQVTSTDMMKKYFHLGTAANLQGLNDIHSLPWRNLQETADPAVSEISGEVFCPKNAAA